jgi:hypothetical protein
MSILGIRDSGQKIVTSNIVLHYDAAQFRSYTSGSTTWNDLSGNGNNGTLTNGPGFTTSGGGAITLDGVDDIVDFGDKTSFTPTSSGFSIEIWYYQTIDISGSGGYSYLDKWTTGGPTAEWLFGGAGGGALYAWLYDNVNGGFIGRLVTSSDTHLNTSAWNQTVWTYNGGTTDGSNKIYINSVQRDNSNLNFGGTFVSVPNGGLSMALGRNNSGLGNGMKGDVSCVNIYSKELSSTEVTQNYNAIKSRFGL